ncbi:MAG TPA: NAD-dependent epimerase/dehydratase family protein [Polyangiaceae bacterium]|nr:NAD-dependent epimerase/dehydratase family protein [Polyangiaceae bacterium]
MSARTETGQPGPVLVTGAAGVMGRRLVRGLLARGARVRGLTLPNDPARAELAALGCEVVEGDLSEPDSLRDLTRGISTVYHLAAIILSHDPSVFQRVNLEGTAHLVQAAAASSVEHFIYVSSASVVYPRRTPYAESKLAAEEVLRAQTGLHYTIVRPTLVYDEHGGQEFVIFREFLLRYPVVPFVGSGLARKRPVFSQDVIDGLLLLLENPKSYGKLYNFSGGEPITLIDLARLVLRHAGQQRSFVHVPVPLCRAVAKVLKVVMERPPITESAIAGLVNHADLDPSEAIADLGYRPLGVHAGFERCFPIARAGLADERMKEMQS